MRQRAKTAPLTSMAAAAYVPDSGTAFTSTTGMTASNAPAVVRFTMDEKIPMLDHADPSFKSISKELDGAKRLTEA